MNRTACLTIATALCGVALALSATSALAQSPSVDGYDETGLSTIPPIDASPPTTRTSSPGAPAQPDAPGPSPSDELPFTGFGVPLLALLGGAFVAAGALTRWRLRSQVS